MRRAWIWLIAAAGLALAAYTAFWYVTARRIEAGLAVWIDDRRAAGWTVDAGPRRLAGWPVVASVVVRDVVVAIPPTDIPDGLTWRAQKVALAVTLRHPSTLEIVPGGIQRLGPAGGPSLEMAARSLLIRAPIGPAGPTWPAVLEGKSVRLGAGSRRNPAEIDRIAGSATADAMAGAGGTALAFSVTATEIDLPSGKEWPLGRRLQSASARAEVSGPVPPAGEPGRRAQTWRDGGGRARIEVESLRWGPLTAAAHADVTLDETLQPEASGQARLGAYEQALDVLAAHHAISDHAALAAKAVLSLVAATPPDGGPPEVDVPFTASKGILALGKIPLARLPPINW